ncbi:CLUMA_CG003647, isoform A [Clunio marinus]|uniref:CLUMA_CG003647, isoform A n=1 Tax=Clunio marinus TaxID=568069 RepID=A0A1J1HR98_9DIPT|nr:CLUMA_CG003647, isoform A [Clunio marinus]
MQWKIKTLLALDVESQQLPITQMNSFAKTGGSKLAQFIKCSNICCSSNIHRRDRRIYVTANIWVRLQGSKAV